MSVFALLSLLACGPRQAQNSLSEQPQTLHFAAINDFHGALYESPDRSDPSVAMGGLPWLVSAVDALRTDHPDLVLLDGGDLFQGAWPVNASHGSGSVAAFNLLGVDAAAVGNHEFDYGAGAHEGLRGALEAEAKQAQFAWLAANITHESGEPWAPEGIGPTTLIERNGVKIGVIGLSTQDTPQTTLARNVSDLRFTDPVEAVRIAVPALEAQGARVIVVVGHLTGSCEPPDYTTLDDGCRPDGEIGRLLDELPPGTIDLMVVGHAHTLLAQRFDDTFVLEQRDKGKMIGRVDLVVGPNGVDPDASVVHPPWVLSHASVDPGCTGEAFPTEPIDVGGRLLTPSAEALALIDRLEAGAGSLCDEVGCLNEAAGRSRQSESAVGNLVADAMRAATDVDLAMTNSGGLRSDMPAGETRREHIQSMMPFDNRLVEVTLTGAQLLEVFRVGSSGAHGILQLSGGSYHFDPERTEGTDRNGDGTVETWEVDRLCGLQVDGVPVDPNKSYTLVTNDFLTGGGDHLGPAFTRVAISEPGALLRDVIAQWFSEQDGCLDDKGPLVLPSAPRITLGPCPHP